MVKLNARGANVKHYRGSKFFPPATEKQMDATPWAIATDPGTSALALTPDSPPNHASCTWLFLNAVTAAEYDLTGIYFTFIESCLDKYVPIFSKRVLSLLSS